MWAAMWMETLVSRKPKTRESYESIVHRLGRAPGYETGPARMDDRERLES